LRYPLRLGALVGPRHGRSRDRARHRTGRCRRGPERSGAPKRTARRAV